MMGFALSSAISALDAAGLNLSTSVRYSGVLSIRNWSMAGVRRETKGKWKMSYPQRSGGDVAIEPAEGELGVTLCRDAGVYRVKYIVLE